MTSEKIIHNLDSYEVDSVRGFLPKEDPLELLPNAFDSWEHTAAEISILLMSDQLRSTLEKLSLPNISHLENERQIRRAFLLLSVFGNAYVWGGEKPATTIPRTIALPWCEIAKKLDRPPILSYGSMAIDNWKRLDKNQPLELDNLAVLQLFLGGLDEHWFYLTTIAIEAKGSAVIVPLIEIQKSIVTNNFENIAQQLKIIATVLADMYAILIRIPEKCDPYIFYHRVRPFVASWPEPGVIYEGVSETPQKFVGTSAAQSSLIQSLDAGLGIKHQEDKSQLYLHKMRFYMPPLHRNFIEALEAGVSVREFILIHKQTYPILCDLYNDCIQALDNFRKKHLQIAACYITRHSPPQPRGTGGTDFTHFLQEVKQETAEHLIS